MKVNRWKDLSLTILINNNVRTWNVWWRGIFFWLKITSKSLAFFQGVPNNLWFLPALSWIWFTCQTSWIKSDEPFTHIGDKNWLWSRARSWILNRCFKMDMKRKAALCFNASLWEMCPCSYLPWMWHVRDQFQLSPSYSTDFRNDMTFFWHFAFLACEYLEL